MDAQAKFKVGDEVRIKSTGDCCPVVKALLHECGDWIYTVRAANGNNVRFSEKQVEAV